MIEQEQATPATDERMLAVCQWLAWFMFVAIAVEGLITVFWVLARFGWST